MKDHPNATNKSHWQWIFAEELKIWFLVASHQGGLREEVDFHGKGNKTVHKNGSGVWYW